MSRILISAFFLLCLIGSNAGANELSGQIDKVLTAKCLSREKSGVSVVLLSSGKSIYDHNGDRALLPASILKLFTTSMALHYLGPLYKFHTAVFYTGTIENHRLKGDLVIRGGGDPKLTPEKVWSISREIKWRGIDKIEGDLIVDESFFDGRDKAPGWRNNRSNRAYDAKLGALSVSYNTVAVHVYPARIAGKRPTIVLDPPSALVSLDNKSYTVTRRGRKLLVTLRTEKGNSHGKLKVSVSGTVRTFDKPKTFYLAIPNPPLFAGHVFADMLEKNGVKLKGKVSVSFLPAKSEFLFVHKSAPLVDILRELNRYSNNFMAEQIARTVASRRSGKPGRYEDAFRLMNAFLKNLGIETGNLVIKDASGLSRQDRITARSMTRLLSRIYARYDLWPDFVGAMAIMGKEGSLKKRLKGSPAIGLVRAKTGSLTGVSNLAGIVSAANGRLYGFTIMLSENSCGHDGADRLEDRIVTAIFRSGGR